MYCVIIKQNVYFVHLTKNIAFFLLHEEFKNVISKTVGKVKFAVKDITEEIQTTVESSDFVGANYCGL